MQSNTNLEITGVINLTIFMYCFFYAVANVAAATIIKKKLLVYTITDIQSFAAFFFDPMIVFSVLLIVISLFFYMKALSVGLFSVVIPVSTGINFMLTVAIGLLFFSDRINLYGVIGLIAILCGVLLIGRGGAVA